MVSGFWQLQLDTCYILGAESAGSVKRQNNFPDIFPTICPMNHRSLPAGLPLWMDGDVVELKPLTSKEIFV